MIKIVIFDFDDTIIDNINFDFHSFSIPNKKLELKDIELEEIINYRKNGLTASSIIKTILKNQNKEKLYQKFVDIREKEKFANDSFRYFSLKEGCKDLLKFINKNKIKCILCTSRENKEKIINFLKEKKIYEYFTYIINKNDILIKFNNSKKLERLFIKNLLLKRILKIENIVPNEILYIGNAEEDYIAAKNMKINFIYFQNYYLKDERISNLTKIKNMNEIKGKLQEMNK